MVQNDKEEAVPRCSRSDGRKWRCRMCETHHLQQRHSELKKKAPESLKIHRKKDDEYDFVAVPEHLRCHRFSGKQWRCRRQVMGNYKMCEIHHLQQRHRVLNGKGKIPESLKLHRKKMKVKPVAVCRMVNKNPNLSSDQNNINDMVKSEESFGPPPGFTSKFGIDQAGDFDKSFDDGVAGGKVVAELKAAKLRISKLEKEVAELKAAKFGPKVKRSAAKAKP